MKIKICLIFSLFFVFTLIETAPAHSTLFTKNTSVMGTNLEMTVNAPDEAQAQGAFGLAEAEMRRIEREMSEWIDGSAVSRINKNAGKSPVAVPDELFKVISASIEVSRLTDGAFDISWASMRGLWNFEAGKERVPSVEEVKKRLRLVDYRHIALDKQKQTVFLKRKGMSIGLGAIAKGYAVDRAMEALASAGIKDAIVKAGGDMRIQGRGEDGVPWEIGIRNPREKDKLLAALKLTNISISTSGDYERFFVKDGLLYHHIMDPKTGFPARGSQSVTIIGPDTMTTDALSTAIFVMGPEKGMELVRALKGIEAIIVDANGKIHTSPGIEIKK